MVKVVDEKPQKRRLKVKRTKNNNQDLIEEVTYEEYKEEIEATNINNNEDGGNKSDDELSQEMEFDCMAAEKDEDIAEEKYE